MNEEDSSKLNELITDEMKIHQNFGDNVSKNMICYFIYILRSCNVLVE